MIPSFFSASTASPLPSQPPAPEEQCDPRLTGLRGRGACDGGRGAAKLPDPLRGATEVFGLVGKGVLEGLGGGAAF